MDRTSPTLARRVIAVLALGLAIAATGCGAIANRGSGQALVEQLELDVSSVDTVVAADIWQVEIVRGEVAGVEITIDDNLRDRVDVAVEGSELKLQIRSGIVSPEVGFNAVVTLPTFPAIKASDSSEVEAKDVTVDGLMMSASDSAKVTLSGSGQTADIEVSDAAKVDMKGFELVDASIDAADAARLDMRVTGLIQGDLSDAARVTTTGGASTNLKTSDAASIKAS